MVEEKNVSKKSSCVLTATMKRQNTVCALYPLPVFPPSINPSQLNTKLQVFCSIATSHVVCCRCILETPEKHTYSFPPILYTARNAQNVNNKIKKVECKYQKGKAHESWSTPNFGRPSAISLRSFGICASGSLRHGMLRLMMQVVLCHS